MKKVSNKVETIFAHAAALQQSGRLRNTIYCKKSFVYILNQDHTVLLRFPVEKEFEAEASFNANDYDSKQFQIVNGKICFVINKGELERTKSCRTPEFSPSDVRKLFQKLLKSEKPFTTVNIGSNFLKCVDESLSHLEFSAAKNELIIRQRNIYTGSIITIKEKSKGLVAEQRVKKFKPMGIRTNDFLALFSFIQSLSVSFGKNAIWVESKAGIRFKGIISQCIYDELGVE